VNPEPFLQLDRVIHEKGRLAIMSLLAASPQLSFTEMRDTLGMTDGNITAHVRTLHEAGYIAVIKAFKGGRQITSYALTADGLFRGQSQAFFAFLTQLAQAADAATHKVQRPEHKEVQHGEARRSVAHAHTGATLVSAPPQHNEPG